MPWRRKVKKTKFSVDFNVSAVDLAKCDECREQVEGHTENDSQWKKNETALKEAAGTKIMSRCRVVGGGRKLFSDSMDKRLKERYDEAFENRFDISRRILVLEGRAIRAELLAENPELESLKLSKGWLDRFLQRHSLTI